ncbi:MAG: hypothetical protein KC475_11750 [Cyanobacteria bacterium HKST-UBA03]|nr:hypothetical protein [Cyanobacteria bacterium HKST-UBA03]
MGLIPAGVTPADLIPATHRLRFGSYDLYRLVDKTPQGIGEEGDQRAVVNQFCADLFAREGDDLPFPRATYWLTPPPESGAFADVLVVSGGDDVSTHNFRSQQVMHRVEAGTDDSLTCFSSGLGDSHGHDEDGAAADREDLFARYSQAMRTHLATQQKLRFTMTVHVERSAQTPLFVQDGPIEWLA